MAPRIGQMTSCRRQAYTWHTFTPEWTAKVGMEEATWCVGRREARRWRGGGLPAKGQHTGAAVNTTVGRHAAVVAAAAGGVLLAHGRCGGGVALSGWPRRVGAARAD